MAVYLTLAAMTIFLGFFVDSKVKKPEKSFFDDPNRTRGRVQNKMIYALIFFLLFAVSATRIAVGGDYWSYTSIFSLLAQNRDKSVATEIGFNLLVKAVQHLFGFDGKQYIIIFAIVAFVTILFFMKGLDELSEDFAISFAMFMLLGYYASSFNSIRSYLAFAVAFYSVKFIFRREFWKFVLLVLLASTFHISMYPQYENTIYDTWEISYTNIARCVLVLIFAIVLYKKVIKDSEKNRFLFNMNIFATIVYICCSFLPVVSRIGYYFNIFQIILIPTLINAIPKKWVRIVLKDLLIAAGFAYYVYFLYSSRTNGTRLIPYFNWIIN